MDESTRSMIKEFGPMWTAKEVREYEDAAGMPKFDMTCAMPGEAVVWDSKLASPCSELRETAADMFESIKDGHELWIAGTGRSGINKDQVPYVMAILADVMSEEEECMNFRREDGRVVAAIDAGADMIDCKEFFEEFYHLAIGFNYPEHSGIPKDRTEAEMHIERLQEEFDARMSAKMGGRYLSGNADLDGE